MPDHVDLVKGCVRQIERWRKDADSKNEQRMVQTYDERLTMLKAIIDEVEHFRRVTKPVPASYGDLSDIPPPNSSRN